MSKNEAGLWKRMRAGLEGQWVAERIENRLNEGISDVYYSADGKSGMVELKHVHGWPATPGGRLVVRSLTSEQQNFIATHGVVGQHTFCLLEVAQPDQELFLFDHETINKLGWMNQREMRDCCLLHAEMSVMKWRRSDGTISNELGLWDDVLAVLTR